MKLITFGVACLVCASLVTSDQLLKDRALHRTSGSREKDVVNSVKHSKMVEFARLLLAFNAATGLRQSPITTNRLQPVQMQYGLTGKDKNKAWFDYIWPPKINPRALFKTNMGNFTVEIFLKEVPIAASNFIALANEGFYDGLHFHRVIPGFMAQFGCPYTENPYALDAGKGGPEPLSMFRNLETGVMLTRDEEGKIRDEWEVKIGNLKGALAMANIGVPDTGGSQFFINVANNEFLNHWTDGPAQHVVFANVVNNYELIENITKVQTIQDRPVKPIKVESVTISPLPEWAKTQDDRLKLPQFIVDNLPREDNSYKRFPWEKGGAVGKWWTR